MSQRMSRSPQGVWSGGQKVATEAVHVEIQGMQDPGAFEATTEVLIQLRSSVSKFTSLTKYADGLKAKY